MESRTVASTRTQLAQIMTPNEANVLGNVFGGAILAIIDLTASATAQRFSGHVSVTASFDRVDFIMPIEVGELVSMEGRVTYAGRTSMEITIDVTATNLRTGVTRDTNSARVTMVALKDGRPTPVPLLLCETREDKIRFLMGRARRELRKVQLADIEQQRAKLEAATDAQLDEWLEAT